MSASAASPITTSFSLFLIRGLSREAGHWGPHFGNALRSRFPNVELIWVDLPGAGIFYREKAPTTVEKTAVFLQNAYAEQLQQAAGKKVLLATSLAGNVGVSWMAQYPDTFDAAVLVNTSFRNICTPKTRMKPSANKRFLEILFAPNLKVRETRTLAINSNFYAGDESILEDWMEIQRLRPMTRINLFRQGLAGMRYQAKDRPPEIPLLFMASKGDAIVAPPCAEAIHKHFGGTLVWHETAGHGLPIDAPVWMAEQLADWLAAKVFEVE